MTKNENDMKEKIEENEVMEEMELEIENLKNEEGEIDEELVEEAQGEENPQVAQLKDALLKSQADYENFKRRTSRDKDEMVFFIKSKIINPILKRVDDLDRMIKNTPEEEHNTAQFEAIIALEKSLKKDLKDMGVSEFVSTGEEVDPNKHDVMTQVPGKEEGIICDEFEKGYLLDEKVLRVAKVVVGAGE
ncbi:nucleotide exchange factor GrpE [Candidatus Gracilibacteria bacterium]|nr:nucleotide exchange factor GrpE [Candidatus Gracilibacteria bacterium]